MRAPGGAAEFARRRLAGEFRDPTSPVSIPNLTDACSCRSPGRCTGTGSGSQMRGLEHVPDERRRPDRRQPLRRAAARRDHAAGRAVRRAPGGTGTCGCSAPTWSTRCPGSASLARRERAHPGRSRRGRPAAGRRRAGRGVPRGLQGHRQAVQRALPAAAIRPGRLRGHRHRGGRADHPVRDRRGRGDLPDDRRLPRPLARPAAAVLPDDPAVPVARARSARSRCRPTGLSSSATPVPTDGLTRIRR